MELSNIAELRDKLSSLGIEVSAKDGRLRVSAPSGALTEEIQKAVSASKAQLLELLDYPLRHGLGDLPGGRVTLSWGQRRLWLVSQMDGPSAAFNIPLALRLRGRLDVTALENALAEVVTRHAPLRTIVELVEDVPLGRLLPPPAPQALLAHEDISGFAAVERDREIYARYDSEAGRIFDLSSEILVRGRLIRVGADDHILIIVMHHAASDGFSLAVFMRDLTAAYTALSEGKAADLPALRIQYADYAAWQQRWLEQAGKLAQQIGYWRNKLAGVGNLLTVPTDRPRDPLRSRKAGSSPMRLERDLVKQLEVLARQQGGTIFPVILAGYAATLGRLAGQEEIVIGIPIAGRSCIETENLVGFFANTLPLRIDLSGNPDTAALIARAHDVSLDALENQDVPLERLVQELGVPRSRAHTPFFQAVFAWQNLEAPSFEAPGLATEHIFLQVPQAKYDLTLALIRQPDGSCFGEIEYDASLFDKETISRWGRYFIRTLEGMAATAGSQASTPVAALPLLDPQERKLLLETFNDTAAALPSATLPALFEAQVARTPQAIAVVGVDRQLTYADLDAAANRMAHRLIAEGIGPESLVGIALNRSVEAIIALLAILKAGGAYLPLDPEYPAQRIQFMLGDCRAKLLITTSAMAERLNLRSKVGGDASNVPLMFLDDPAVDVDLHGRPSHSPTDADRIAPLATNNLAYVIYTSGSTGQPKGVATTQANVGALAWRCKYAPLGPGQALLQLAPLAFDAATFEIWGALFNGARLVLAPAGPLDLDRIAQTISRNDVDTLWLTAGLLRQVVETHPDLLAGVKQLLAGGDVLPIASVKRVKEQYPGLAVTNGYGPTETTTFACTRLISDRDLDGESIPIGSPIANTRVYVLDKYLSPVPMGIAGELYISGAGVARGYLNRPELTAERFIACPFGAPGERMYRTGDIARWRPDGALEFLGRADGQVKIRGFRIELTEIEAELAGIDGVAHAVVIPREIAGDVRLVAYLVVRQVEKLPPASELRAILGARLPRHMLPSAFVAIEALPLTVNGKLDRERLPIPKHAAQGEESNLTEIESQLAEIWKRVLGLDKINKHDDFFELGGHSLLALRLIAMVEAEFDSRIDLATLFESPTLESFALALERKDEGQFDFRKVVKFHPDGTRPQLFGINSTGAYYLLAKKLGPKWPLTALQLFNPSFPTDRLPGSIEEIAAQYVELIRQLQPHGPYHLLSWCAGGVLTMEIAQQLLAANEQVAFIAHVEAFAPIHFKRFGWLQSRLAMNSFRLQWNFAEFKKVLDGKQSLFRFLTYRRTFQLAARFIKPLRRSRPEAEDANFELWLQAEYLGEIAKKYQLKPFPGRIHLYRAAEMPKGLFLDKFNGWGAYATEGVEVSFIDGDHHSIFRPPGVDQLAEEIASALAKEDHAPTATPPAERSGPEERVRAQRR